MNCINAKLDYSLRCGNCIWFGRNCSIKHWKELIETNGIIEAFKMSLEGNHPRRAAYFKAAVKYYYPIYIDRLEKLKILA